MKKIEFSSGFLCSLVAWLQYTQMEKPHSKIFQGNSNYKVKQVSQINFDNQWSNWMIQNAFLQNAKSTIGVLVSQL